MQSITSKSQNNILKETKGRIINLKHRKKKPKKPEGGNTHPTTRVQGALG